jgi:hypothetical protein
MVPRSGIQKKPIPDPGSRGQKGTGSGIRIRDTDILYVYFSQYLKPEFTRLYFYYFFFYSCLLLVSVKSKDPDPQHWLRCETS